MKTYKIILLCILALLLNFNSKATSRIVEDFNFNWKFARHEQVGAEKPDFNDTNWKNIRLPHDWSVTEDFSQENTAGATAFLPGGIAWYRKSFDVPSSFKDKITWIEFDGVYNNAEVWINGHYLGMRPYGYIPFSYELTPYLLIGKKNVIAVKADRSAYVDCRWYPGSGIYRNVKLVTVNKTYIPQWGTFITTPEVSKEKATVNLLVTVKSASQSAQKITVQSTIIDDANKTISSQISKTEIASGKSTEIQQIFAVKNPNFWNTETPCMYSMMTKILRNGKVLDEYVTPFGIREIRYDANNGFFLNGVNTPIKGVCLHHDGGLVGAAVPDGVWIRRLNILKEAGVNAIRTAHNPPSEAFLNLCDKMGFLVQDESFDEMDNPKSKRHNFNQEKAEQVTKGYTDHFQEWAERDVKTMVLRDRNHPSIIMWSIGNEIEWTYPKYGDASGYWGSTKATPKTSYYMDAPPLSIDKMKELFYADKTEKYKLEETAPKLSKWVKELDVTRPVTANLVIPCVSQFTEYGDALDIVGYSYREVVYDYGHENYPEKMILGTENFPRYHEWKMAVERDFIPGIFIWTGIGYLGESGEWPSHGGGGGLLNLAGFKNPGYHHFKTFWNDKPYTYLTTQTAEKSPYKWDDARKNVVEKTKDWWLEQRWGWQKVNEYWNYEPNQEIAVEVYTNAPEAELLLNGKSFGKKLLNDNVDRIIKWIIPYTAGELVAKAYHANGEVSNYPIRTSGEPANIELSADVQQIKANNYDVVHVFAELNDENGYPVKNIEKHISFKVEGDCRILGTDNGADTNVNGFYKSDVETYRGKCLLILQANASAGTIKVTASGEGINSMPISVKIEK